MPSKGRVENFTFKDRKQILHRLYPLYKAKTKTNMNFWQKSAPFQYESTLSLRKLIDVNFRLSKIFFGLCFIFPGKDLTSEKSGELNADWQAATNSGS